MEALRPRLGIFRNENKPVESKERIASYVAFTRENAEKEIEVFLGRGKDDQWGFPGGGRKKTLFHLPWFHIDPETQKRIPHWRTEAPDAIARRETYEETGVRVPRRKLALAFAVQTDNTIVTDEDQQQFSYLYTTKYGTLPRRFLRKLERVCGQEMNGSGWFTMEKAYEQRQSGSMPPDVLLGVEIAIWWHETHLRDRLSDKERGELLQNIERRVQSDDNFR